MKCISLNTNDMYNVMEMNVIGVWGCYVKYVVHIVSAKQSIPMEEQHKREGQTGSAGLNQLGITAQVLSVTQCPVFTCSQ